MEQNELKPGANAMNEWGFIGQDSFVARKLSGESPPQVLNLNQGVPACRQGYVRDERLVLLPAADRF